MIGISAFPCKARNTLPVTHEPLFTGLHSILNAFQIATHCSMNSLTPPSNELLASMPIIGSMRVIELLDRSHFLLAEAVT